MSETSHGKIRQKTLELLGTTPSGLRYSELHRAIAAAYPDIPPNTIHGGLHSFRTKLPPEIKLVTRGLYRHIKFIGASDPAMTEAVTPGPVPPVAKLKVREEDFYQPFADWLVNDLEECTDAKPLGGNKFGSKWGTPDIVGVRLPRRGDIIKQPEEVTSAEVKIDTQGLITAFGQACAYKLFSHRSYIVVPKTSLQEDRDRLTALAQIFGIGLVLFNADNKAQPEFDIQVRAARHEPDYFYVNENLKLVWDELFG